VGELPALITHYRELARLAEAGIATCRCLFQVLGVHLPLTAQNLAPRLAAIEVLQSPRPYPSQNRWFGWLADDEIKRAGRVGSGIHKDRAKVTREEMAQAFKQLAEHLEAVQKFHLNDRLRVICGKACDGRATDFDGLLAVHDFACEVTRPFPGNAPNHQEARRLLLESDIVALDAARTEGMSTPSLS
jgi:hypothetical protein